MKSHELSKQLLKMSNSEIGCSVCIPTSTEHREMRCYGDFCDINVGGHQEIVLIFENGSVEQA